VVFGHAQSGTEKWKSKTDSEIASSPAVAEGMVFVRSNDGYLYALK
jgi:outer membrane protein assembly factor BamB